MKIKFLGAHNVETKTARLPGILVDGVLALDAASLTSSLSLKEQLGLKAVLLTHQHFDHVRDVPILGMNLYVNEASVTLYGPIAVRDALAEHFLNGSIYPRYLEKPNLDFYPVEPLQSFCVDKYTILPVPVHHSVPAVGYEITAGKKLFYTGDTGVGLSEVWQHVRPDLLIVEVTASDRWAEFGRTAGHLTPQLLKEELSAFKKLKGYLPPVYAVHMNPYLEEDIARELKKVAGELRCVIKLAREGMEIRI